uniref:Domain of unknown function DB domain-containing protein n=1 Tax=Acrobeloides nanus TaxID=290746 RepID=A0A914CJU5_9BILA
MDNAYPESGYLTLIMEGCGCIGLGGCGGGGGGGCGCGRGCARARASKTLRLGEGGKPLSEMSPDEQFMECCRDRLLPDSCLSHCSYRTYTADVLRAMFLRIDACPIQAASDMHFCASQSQDHRRCCAERGIGYTAAGAKCFIFCDEEPRNSTQLDMTFLPCLDKFEDMKSCFWHEANSHKALDADDGGKLYSLDRHIERARLSQPRSNQPLAPIDFSEFYPLNQQQQFAL